MAPPTGASAMPSGAFQGCGRFFRGAEGRRAGALLRFSDLGARSFWRDEGATVELVRRSFVSMLRALPGSEGTPPLYYVLIWPWSRIFGSDEVGLRSFSAL